MERVLDYVGSRLATVLQKPEQEMVYMLKRTHLLQKRNQKKAHLDRTFNLIRQTIELGLKT